MKKHSFETAVQELPDCVDYDPLAMKTLDDVAETSALGYYLATRCCSSIEAVLQTG